MAASLSVHITAYLLFFSAQGLGALYAGAAAFGFFYGGLTTLLPALVGDFFGRLHAGSITGFLFAWAGVLGAWGPMIAGYLRDVSGSYQSAFLYGAGTGGLALVLLLLTPRPAVSRRAV
jgi:OFA family oxalate/formate antiporter-like MFS transporter